jgi:tripartite-type tricarboxylate transporter receptor subunit TctC
MKRITFLAILLGSSLGVLGGAVSAQTSTNTDKPIKILVGFPPGGSADVMARVLAERMTAKLGGQSVIVENKPGAAGRIAIDALKASAPDGTTLFVTPSGPMVIFPHVFKKLSFDPVKDLTPVSQLAGFQFAIVSGPKSGAKNIAEMLAKAKSDPSTASFASPGTGTVPQFLGVMLSDAAKVELQHVPFQGGAPALNALLGGHVGYGIDVVSESLEAHKSGKARIIAVSSAKRSSELPDVPTLREQGVPMDASAWFAIYGPANMPPAVLARINKAVVEAINDPAAKAKLSSMGFDVIGSTPEQLAAVQKSDLNKWEKPIKATGFQAD